MQASWKWLSEWVDLGSLKGPKELAEILTRRGLEVEGVRALSQGFEKVVTVKILERNRHPQADRLSLCKVSTGQGEPLEIVCGAQNMKAGDIVALAQIGALLPNGLKIELSKIRGVVSNGMLCSESELGLAKESEGILLLPPGTPLGKPLAEILGRDDTLLEMNLTPNRGDCLSHQGLAREISAALKKPLQWKSPQTLKLGGSPIQTRLEAGDLAPQFLGCLIEGVKIGPSPEWMKKRLEAIGARSINNVVDCTNWVLYELGQPTHCYDADRLEGNALSVRMAKPGEKLPLLDQSEISLVGTELVIADAKKAVALAGVMGGGNSEVTEKTTRIFLECAEFAPVPVRRAAFLHQRRTEAALRFEKGIDPEGLAIALSRLAHLIVEVAGGKIIGGASAQSKNRGPGFQRKKIPLQPDYIPNILGVSLDQKEVQEILAGLGCKVEGASVTVPSYRLDLSIREDLAEEIARSIGYDQIPSTLPPLTTAPETRFGNPKGLRLELISRTQDVLAREGVHETLHFAFNSREWLSQFGLESSVFVKNPLSEEHQALVPSLIPGLVQASLLNWNHHFGSEALPIRLFELRPVFSASGEIKAQGEIDTGVRESMRLAMVLSGPRYASALRQELGEVDLLDMKSLLEALIEEWGARGVRLRAAGPSAPNRHLYHPYQSFEVVAGKDIVGTFGLMHPALSKKLKCRAALWMGELDWDAVAQLARSASQPRTFKPWSEFPGIERDFALLVKDQVTTEQIVQTAVKTGRPMAKVVKVFDIYRGSQVAQGMTSIAVRVIFSDENRSLREEEVDQASSKILQQWKAELGAELRT